MNTFSSEVIDLNDAQALILSCWMGWERGCANPLCAHADVNDLLVIGHDALWDCDMKHLANPKGFRKVLKKLAKKGAVTRKGKNSFSLTPAGIVTLAKLAKDYDMPAWEPPCKPYGDCDCS